MRWHRAAVNAVKEHGRVGPPICRRRNYDLNFQAALETGLADLYHDSGCDMRRSMGRELSLVDRRAGGVPGDFSFKVLKEGCLHYPCTQRDKIILFRTATSSSPWLHLGLAASSLHAQAFLYRPDIGLYLPEICRISRLDIFSQAFDLI